MDTSEQYIKMCEKAVEIQKLWKRKTGDFALNVPGNNSIPVPYIVCAQTWGKDIWLPRQDQLQEMVDEVDLAHLAWRFDKFCNSSRPNPFRPDGDNYLILASLTSMEQLWLAFVMKEKCSKVWDGEDWISTSLAAQEC